MSFSRRAAISAALAGGFFLSSDAMAADASNQPTNQELLDKVSKLEAKVEKLESERLEVQHTKVDVQFDAAKRESLGLDAVNTRFHDGTLEFATPDGNFRLHPMFHFVFRDISNFRDRANGPGTGSDSENGMEIRRMEFGAEGNAFNKNLSYFLLYDTDRHNGRPILELAFAQYHFDDSPWSIKAGQIKDPFDKEQLGSSAQFVAVERTLAVDVLAAGDAFTHGASILYDARDYRWELAFTDGFASANQTFQDFPVNVADWGTAGRFEYKLFGDWNQYHTASARANTKDLLVIGGGLDYTEAGSMAAFRHVVDAIYKTGHLGLYGSYLGRYTRHNEFNGVSVGSTYDWTIRAQASYALDDHIEPFVRYDYMNLASKTIGAGLSGHVHEITAGANYYFYGQGAKFTVDLDYLPNGSPISDDGTGVLSNGKASQLLLRANFQIAL